MKRTFATFLSVFLFLCVTALPGAELLAAEDPKALDREINRAEYYVTEFEKEIKRLRGGRSERYFNKKEASERVKSLHERHPGDPRVQALFERMRGALMGSKGDFITITPEMLAYREQEKNLQERFARIADEAWAELLQQEEAKLVQTVFPTPNWEEVSLESLRDSSVVLSDVRWPMDEFIGATGKFIAVGAPSKGYWFINSGGRQWVGPWEAVKRYRRQVDSELEEQKSWTVLARITDLAVEIPQAEEKKTMAPQWGWVVRPVAIHAPGKVTALYAAEQAQSGKFAGEEQVAELKSRGYSVKDLPEHATPIQVMETFVTAIKEKNIDLYLKCIDPARLEGRYGEAMVKGFHWDLHQARFRKHYVAVTFDEPRIVVNKGFDEGDDADSYFLSDSQKETARKIQGTKVEYAYVDCKAWDENGRQYGSPKEYTLKRVDGGRWMIETYDIPF
ncbi:MAG: hypothetical protein HQQ73_10460 [Desulfobulbaceae bacterium]|nr:hypothetical protein [Desulfobulbaceae bacterium]